VVYGCSKRSDSRRTQVYAETMEASAVLRVGSVSSMNEAFVFVPPAGDEHHQVRILVHVCLAIS
jgi:hypothetical protein